MSNSLNLDLSTVVYNSGDQTIAGIKTFSSTIVGNISGTASGGAPPTGSAGGDLTGTYPNPTIATNAVTNAKLARMPANTFKGNNTGSLANALDLTIAQTKTALNIGTQNANGVEYYDGINLVSGTFLTYDGSGTVTLSTTNASAYFIAKSTVTGRSNVGGYKASRGDINGYAELLMQTGTTDKWSLGLRINDDSLHFYDQTNSVDRFIMTQSGSFQINALTASKIVLTDSSKNLVSSTAGIGSQATNGMVRFDGTNFISDSTVTAVSNQINVVNNNPGGSQVIIADQQDTTTATSHAVLRARVGGISAGDPHTQYTVTGGTDWVTGIDNSDSDAYVISSSATLGSNNCMRIDTSANIQITSLQINTTSVTGGQLNVVNAGSASNGGTVAYFGTGSGATAGNLCGIVVDKNGTDSILIGINKNTTTGSVAANSTFISTYQSNGSISIGRGSANSLPNTTDIGIGATGEVTIGTGNLNIGTLGKTLRIKQGSNACAGTGAVMVAGTVTVNTTAVATGDIVFLMKTANGGSTTIGMPAVTIVNGTSFTITGAALDTSTWSWIIFKAAP